MKHDALLELLKNISSWSELESLISRLPTAINRGEAFEVFCKAFFILEPVFQFKEVYSQSEMPYSLRERLGYPDVQDIGIDGLAVTSDDKLYAYQAKFRTERNNTPTLRELSTFFTMSDKADWRIVISNANKLPSSIDDRVRQGRVLSDSLDKLDADFFNRLRLYLKEQQIVPPKAKTPRKDQKEAIDKALSHFVGNDKGQLILPCGTGKTLTAMWIAEKLSGKRILVMLPSLALLSQTLREWAANTLFKPFRYLCLCSDTTVDLGNDSPIENLYEIDIPVSTDAEVVADFLSNKHSTPSILFSTYQSSKVLSEATIKTNTCFDVAIFDEAHRTTGTSVGIWNTALDDKKVPIKKRIFMTATPRICLPHIIKKAQANDVLICSMDDEKIYGKPFYEMTFGNAIEEQLITDYKVIVISVTDSEVKNIIKNSGNIIVDKDHEWDAKGFAKRIALVKGIAAYGLKKIFTFHSRVHEAKAFTDTSNLHGIHQVVEMIASEELKKKNIKYFHVNGTMSSGVRNSLLQEFKEADIGIMSNARCLTEGMDIPTVDTIAFIDSKKSLIDIVQATGRAMRKAEWKGKGYIFIPVIVDDDADPETFIESSDFETVWKVLQAMLEQDHQLQDIVSQLRTIQGMGAKGTQAWKDSMTKYNKKIEFFNLPIKIDKASFIQELYAKTIEIVGRSWDFWYGLTLRFREQTGDANAPYRYKTPEGFQLGNWQSRQRHMYRQGILSEGNINRLEEIGFVWEVRNEAWEEGFQATLKYKEQTGDANSPKQHTTPEGFLLGNWQSHQKNMYRQGNLSEDNINRLEEIGFVWDMYDEAWEQGFQSTLKFKEQTGDANSPKQHTTPEGFSLGSWQNSQRMFYKKGKLAEDRIKRLEAIGFVWSQYDEAWEQGFQATLKYKEQTGDANSHRRHKTPEGFQLGRWQNRQKTFYKRDKLPEDRIKRLEEIGFVWSLYDEVWEEGFQATLKYKKQTGDANSLNQYTTPEGFSLGSWQNSQRMRYKNGKLAEDRIKRLEEIGFVWLLRDDAWEQGVQATLKYKEQTGNPNAPHSYETSKGFKLYGWQMSQRAFYKKGTLAADRIKRLEEIGFVWSPYDELWEQRFQATLKFKEQTGNANAPDRYETFDGMKLGKWQGNQKTFYIKGTLAADRIKRLEEIGFKWSKHRK
ncbi:MAG: Helicase associated domain protein [Thermodesulfovibrionales bacterium]